MQAGTISFWTPEGLQQATDGTWLNEPQDGQVNIPGLSIDSRAIAAGQVFLALRGDNFDGHDFVNQALDAGAGAIIIDQAEARPFNTSVPVLLVDDTLAALHALTRRYRSVLQVHGVKVIAVCGSNGKTTTRHMIHTALTGGERKLRGTQSPRSFNNHIGVPLTLLGASTEHDFVVVEVGSNHPGEIDALGQLVQPDAAVITNIGHEHMAFFKTLGGVAKEEAAILSHIRDDALVVVHGAAWEAIKGFVQLPSDVKLIRYGEETDGCDLCPARPLTSTESGTNLAISQSVSIHLPLLGLHNAINALAAVAIARWFDLPDAIIAEALRNIRPVEMRLQLVRIGAANKPDEQVLLINDAYNANPDSMIAGLRTLAEIDAPRHIAILGDMLELGEQEPDLHRMVGKALASEQRIDQVVLIGRYAMFIAEVLARTWPQERVHVFPRWSDDVPEQVVQIIEHGDAVLIKASRGMQLERLVPAITQRFSPA